MGILIRQEGEKWLIELREHWKVPQIDVSELVRYFQTYPCRPEIIATSTEYTAFLFQNSRITLESLEEAKKVACRLLDWKLKYSHHINKVIKYAFAKGSVTSPIQPNDKI